MRAAVAGLGQTTLTCCTPRSSLQVLVTPYISKAAAVACKSSAPGSDARGEPGDAREAMQPELLLPPAPELSGIPPQGRFNAVSLAYLGDAIWEAMLRGRFYDAVNAWQYNNKVATMANTQAQAACYKLLLEEGWVTAAEAALMRWATNNSSVAPPSHATRQQYKHATAVEALVAHLYLTDTARLQQLMDWLLEAPRVEQWRQPMPVPANQGPRRSRTSGSGQGDRGSKAPPGSQDTPVVQGGRRVRGTASRTRAWFSGDTTHPQ